MGFHPGFHPWLLVSNIKINITISWWKEHNSLFHLIIFTHQFTGSMADQTHVGHLVRYVERVLICSVLVQTVFCLSFHHSPNHNSVDRLLISKFFDLISPSLKGWMNMDLVFLMIWSATVCLFLLPMVLRSCGHISLNQSQFLYSGIPRWCESRPVSEKPLLYKRRFFLAKVFLKSIHVFLELLCYFFQPTRCWKIC